ncbi:hypothetical protein BASA81_009667 [Batrachochytrium salamandrivorans]|nr:hypothetical protein BASA81_009667 [Batrachochytrium salamandrivorans]
MVKITIVICGAIDSLSSASIDSIDASDIPSTDCLLSLKKSVPSQGGSIDSVQPDQLLWGRAINLAKMSREKRAELYTSYLTGLMGSGVVGIVGIMALLTAYAVQDVSAGSDDPEIWITQSICTAVLWPYSVLIMLCTESLLEILF